MRQFQRFSYSVSFWGVLLFTLLSTEIVTAQDSINWVSIDEALDRASDEEKLILIDVFAPWCPYCQRMQKEVYPDENVEEAIDDYFLPVRISVESDDAVQFMDRRFTQAEFARALKYQSVPTTYFMNAEGEVVGQQPGYLPEDIFTSLLRYVGSGAYETQSFEEFEP
ncbi:MAG: thioredoxin family protein [Bacteroidota bacterium]